jgi:transcriptional regulator with XRE-family HTH domain
VELSRRTGINQPRIGEYIRGKYEAKQPAVYAISEALDVDPAWLMGYDVPMEPRLCANKVPKKSIRKATNEELKLALFGNPEASDDLLEDIKSVAKMFLKDRSVAQKKNKSRK